MYRRFDAPFRCPVSMPLGKWNCFAIMLLKGISIPVFVVLVLAGIPAHSAERRDYKLTKLFLKYSLATCALFFLAASQRD